MSQSTEQLTKESSNTHTHAGEAIKHDSRSIENTEIAYNERYGEGPIWVRGGEGVGYFATLGDERLTIAYPTKEDVELKLTGVDWEMILNVITCAFLFLKKAERVDAEEAIQKETEEKEKRYKEWADSRLAHHEQIQKEYNEFMAVHTTEQLHGKYKITEAVSEIAGILKDQEK